MIRGEVERMKGMSSFPAVFALLSASLISIKQILPSTYLQGFWEDRTDRNVPYNPDREFPVLQSQMKGEASYYLLRKPLHCGKQVLSTS